MGVLWVRPIWEGRDGSFSGFVDEETSLAWKVKTDNKFDNPIHLIQAIIGMGTVPVPGYLELHPNSPYHRCKNLTITQESESPYSYIATATYDNRPLNEDEQTNQVADPLERVARIRWSSQLVTTFTDKDKDDKAMLNSATDPLQPLEVDDVRWIITVEKNLTVVPTWVASYANKVNSSQFTVDGVTIGARKAKMQQLDISEPLQQNDVAYRAVRFEMAYKGDTWDFVRLDEGFRYLSGDDRLKILNDDGSEPTEPVPLDENGDVMTKTALESSGGHFKTFKVYKEADFNALPLS